MALLMKITVIFSPLVADVDGLGGADCGKVAVALICEYCLVGVGALYSRRNGGCSAVRRFDHITVEIVICKNRAADGCDTDGLSFDSEFVKNLGDKTVNYAVSTAGAVVEGNIGECVGFFKYGFHCCFCSFPLFRHADELFSIFRPRWVPCRPFCRSVQRVPCS